MENQKIVFDQQMLSCCCNVCRVNEGGRVVLTTGAFDVLPEGHLGYLKHAKGLGDFLVVGVNDDDFVREFKGLDRPYHPQQKRALNVASIDCVDMVYIFSLDEQVKIIELVSPTFFVMSESSHRKPADRQPQLEAVTRVGGEIVLLPPFSNVHSTDLIRELRGK